jgi:hypothetical protein
VFSCFYVFLAFRELSLAVVVPGCSSVFIAPLQRKKIGSVSGKMRNLFRSRNHGLPAFAKPPLLKLRRARGYGAAGADITDGDQTDETEGNEGSEDLGQNITSKALPVSRR